MEIVELNQEDSIDDFTATLLVTAIINNHTDMDEEDQSPDPFFTPEEWKRKTDSLLKMFKKGMADSKFPHQEEYELLSSSICQCEAHASKDKRINELIDIPEPLINHNQHTTQHKIYLLVWSTTGEKPLIEISLWVALCWILVRPLTLLIMRYLLIRCLHMGSKVEN